MLRWIAVLLLAATQMAIAAEQLTARKLNEILGQTKRGWIARPTEVSRLSREEFRRRLGLRRDLDTVEFSVPATKAHFHLPQRLDWRNKDGLNWVSPILDQANCGSCVAFATIATLETQYKIATGFAAFNIKLSPQHVFSCGGGSCDYGWFPEVAARYLKRAGVPDEACMPYLSGATGQDLSCNSTCADAAQRSVRLSSYSTPTRRAANLDAVKQALQSGPLVTTLSVYEDFAFYGGGIYRHVSGSHLGGHAVSLIGYDDTERAFIIRNSWGVNWGESGFGRVSYDDISGVGNETWSYQVAPPSGAVTVESPLDYSYWTGDMAVNAHAMSTGTASVTMAIYNGAGNPVASVNCSGQDCANSLDITTLPDGRYEAQAVARDGGGGETARSTRQLFYVANQSPTLGLSFVGTKGTDLDKPLSDRIEILIRATSNSVPMSSVDFHYRGADGVDHVRTALTVVDGMTMGWRTNLVPNGTYELWLTGRVRTNRGETVVETPHKTVRTSN